METYGSAAAMVRERRPENPVIGFRPHAVWRAARWFTTRFPGRVLYAVKANDDPKTLDILHAGGIRHFDVASLPELDRVAGLTDAQLYFMNPVKTPDMIAKAYFNYGVRHFVLDSLDELDKILTATCRARDLNLHIRLAISNTHSLVPLEGKYGLAPEHAGEVIKKARACAAGVGLCFHVGSQAMRPESYSAALALCARLIAGTGVMVDYIDVGGGFPVAFQDARPPTLSTYVAEIMSHFESLPVGEGCRLLTEPGRALVAESESVIVQVMARNGDRLYLNDGIFGTLFEGAQIYSSLSYPARLVCGAELQEGAASPLVPFRFYGPTCDSADYMPGPFHLPADIAEGDYIEIGNIGAYGRVLSSKFNGFGRYDQVLLSDEPMLSMYDGFYAGEGGWAPIETADGSPVYVTPPEGA